MPKRNKPSKPKTPRSRGSPRNGSKKKLGTRKRARRAGGDGISGTYMQTIPTAVGVRTSTDLQKGIRMKKREFITNVGHDALGAKGHKLFKSVENNGNGLLTSIAELSVNVGLNTVFPWLSNVAQFFDKFMFHMCKFDYVPSTGSTTQGTVALCPTYKSDEANDGATKSDLLDRAGSSRSAAWQTNSCRIDPKKANAALKSHFVRSGSVEDVKLTDPARLDIFIETPAAGQNTNNDLGELWVEYDVSLEVPKGMTDSKNGSAADFEVNGAGSSKVLSYVYKAPQSSIFDWDRTWVEPDSAQYWLHVPFKKVGFCVMTAYMGSDVSLTLTTVSKNTVWTDFTTPAGVRVAIWLINMGIDVNGEYSEAAMKYGVRFGTVLSSTANYYNVLSSEIGEQLYKYLESADRRKVLPHFTLNSLPIPPMPNLRAIN